MADHKVLVDIGVACSGFQTPTWWSKNFANLIAETQLGTWEIGKILAISSALPDWNKGKAVDVHITGSDKPNEIKFANPEEKKRNNLTDANRLKIAEKFMQSGAEYIMFIDDDTVMPRFAVTNLMKHNVDVAAGLYFNPNPPMNPIAYLRNEDGSYKALYKFPGGWVGYVDSVGFGCTLVKKDVFRKIAEEHIVYMRPNGSLFPIHKSAVYQDVSPTRYIGMPDTFVSGEWLFMKTTKQPEDDNRYWPYFVMEYGRTEDHHFFELAANVGIRPLVDTNIRCGHIKSKEYGYEDYKKYLQEEK